MSVLGSGGAETQLLHLLNYLKDSFDIGLSVTHGGGLRQPCIPEHVSVEVLSDHSASVAGRIRSAIRFASRFRPDVVYSFEEGPNVLGLVLARACRCPLVWGIRSSVPVGRRTTKSKSYALLNRIFSRVPDRIVYNSERGARSYNALGYPVDKAAVIRNGFDGRMLYPDPASGARQRKAWAIGDDVLVVGLVGSLKPDKNHPLLIEAARRVTAEKANVVFISVGARYDGVPDLRQYAEECRASAADLEAAGRFRWCGESKDMRAVYNAIDLLVLCSLREGMPNVLAESLLCGTTCLSTDVGDAREMLGGPENLFEADVDAMARRIKETLDLTPAERTAQALRARDGILERYSLESLARNTTDLLNDVAARRSTRA